MPIVGIDEGSNMLGREGRMGWLLGCFGWRSGRESRMMEVGAEGGSRILVSAKPESA